MKAFSKKNYAFCHDYSNLIEIWHSLSSANHLRIKKFAESDGHPLFEISSLANGPEKLIYLSAGIHGDEPAGVWGLLYWLLNHIKVLHEINLLIYPCLNPWGFINNSRLDSDGRDLNRYWHSKKKSAISSIKERINGLDSCLAINLHEDFDADGIYLYESTVRKKHDDLAHEILSSGSKHIPIDSRKKIEGRWSKNGIIRPTKDSLPKEGLPEAAFLQENFSGRTFVFETPSEYDLGIRVKAHIAMLERTMKEFLTKV